MWSNGKLPYKYYEVKVFSIPYTTTIALKKYYRDIFWWNYKRYW